MHRSDHQLIWGCVWQAAQTIQLLGKYLNREKSLPIQVEALHALHNLCKISRGRQEEAARVGLVPYLMSLAQMSRKQVCSTSAPSLAQMLLALTGFLSVSCS